MRDVSAPLLLAAFGLLLFAVVRWAMLEPPSVPGAAQLPDPAELDSSRRYLRSVGELPLWLDETGLVLSAPRSDVPNAWHFRPAPLPPPPLPGERGPRRHAVTAILIHSGTRMAVIDDRGVLPGDRLAGGTRVVRIESDHVVLQEPDGTRTVARLRTEGDD
jgi:hypothetical protein